MQYKKIRVVTIVLVTKILNVSIDLNCLNNLLGFLEHFNLSEEISENQFSHNDEFLGTQLFL